MALLETFQDDFSGTPADRWDTSGTVTFTAGAAELAASGLGAAQISTKGTFEFGYVGAARDTYVYAKIDPSASASDSSANEEVMLAAADATSSALVGLYLNGPVLYRRRITSAGAVSNSAIVAYDRTQHAYWRVRATGTSVALGTSPDGVVWTDRHTVSFAPASNTQMRAVVSLKGVHAAMPATTVVVDNVNTLGPPPPTEVAPLAVGDPEVLGAPAVTVSQGPRPASIQDGEALAAPGVTFVPGEIAPAGITDPDTVGTPTLTGAPLRPAGIADPEQVGAPGAAFTAASGLYGDGPYGQGVYGGQVPPVQPEEPPTGNPVDNPTYGSGTYGYGIYRGATEQSGENLPLFPQPDTRVRTALHLLAIGPWNGYVNWRGAANYNIRPGRMPARPTLALPNAQTKSFTLRLNDANEARAEFGMARRDAIVVDEMVTDLWWRRKDPYTGQLEMIGRFNASHVDIARTDTGLSVSCQFEDYRQILGDRLILRYLHPTLDPPVTQWLPGTPVSEVLAWALPKNTGIDLSAVTGPNPVDLGALVQPFHLPLGTTIDDTMSNLAAVSPQPWEWWVDTPADVGAAPKLAFTLGQRGADKGVTLFDYGTGPTPIANWTRRAASDQYANSLFYSGGTGGVAVAYDAQILEYGQRDAQDGNSSLKGDIKAIMAAADQRLRQLADRRPTFTVTVKPGWWRGRAHVDVGDIVRIEILLDRELLSERYRVSEIQCDVDGTGTETVTFTFGNPLPSGNPRSKRSPLARLVRKLKNYQTPPGSDNDVGLGDDALTYYVPNESDAPYVGP